MSSLRKSEALRRLEELREHASSDPSGETKDKKLVAVKALSIVVDLGENDDLIESICNSDANIDRIVELWGLVKSELDTILSCKFRTPPASSPSSTPASPTSSNPPSPRSERAMVRATGLRPKTPPVRRKDTVVASVLQRDDNTCVVTGCMNDVRYSEYLKTAPERTKKKAPLEVAHIFGFALARFVRSLSNYVVDREVRAILEDGVSVDVPQNCVTLAQSIHHRSFGVEWWIVGKYVNGTPKYKVEISPTSADWVVPRLIRDGQEIKFADEYRPLWPSIELCNLTAKVGRILQATAAAGLYEPPEWRDEDYYPEEARHMTHSASEQTLIEAVEALLNRKHSRDEVSDTDVPFIAI